MSLDAPCNNARRKEIERIKSMEVQWTDICRCDGCSGSSWKFVSHEDRNGLHWQITQHIKKMQKNKEKAPSFEYIIVIIARIAFFLDFGTLEHIYEEWVSGIEQYYPLKMNAILWNKKY